MKAILSIIICSLSLLSAHAQEFDDDLYLNGMVPVGTFEADTPQYADSLRLPVLDYNGRMPNRCSWYLPCFSGLGPWELHSGMNVNLGLSAFTSFGKNAFSGWGQNVAAMYASSVNDHLSYAIGGYMNNVSSGIGAWREVGFSAVLNYRFNEHWEAFVYAQKSLSEKGNGTFGYTPLFGTPNAYYPCLMSPFYNGGDKVGAGVRYNFNNDFSVQMLFEYQHFPSVHRSVEERWPHPGNASRK